MRSRHPRKTIVSLALSRYTIRDTCVLEEDTMSRQEPKLLDSPLFSLLREGRIAEFNERKAQMSSCDFRGGDFRGSDLRGMNADGIDFEDAYFRGADLRGIDLREANLQGASMARAHISGCYFPDELTPHEIIMSVDRGTRLRYRKDK